MTMTSIVICLLLEMLTAFLVRYRQYDWADSYAGRIQHFFTGGSTWESPWGVVAVLLVPCLLVIFLQSILSGYLLGFFGLVFSIVVLAYSLRYQPLERDVDKIILALENRDLATASYLASELLGEPINSEKDLVRKVCSALLVSVNERLFAVILWFVLLGPMGALLYRLSWFYSQKSRYAKGGFKDNMVRLHAILNWLPARLLPIGYALAGSFEDALKGWKEVYTRNISEMAELNHAIITHTGCSALHLQRYQQAADNEDFVELEVEAIQASHSLIMRAMLIWGIVIALLTLAGWSV